MAFLKTLLIALFVLTIPSMGLDQTKKSLHSDSQVEQHVASKSNGLDRVPGIPPIGNKINKSDFLHSTPAPENALLLDSSQERSEEYTDIFNYIISKFTSSRFSCKDFCGNVSGLCSCRPDCYYSKLCCYDFVEQCGDVYPQGDVTRNYFWLETVSMDCVDGVPVVSSCRQSPSFKSRSAEYINPMNQTTSDTLQNQSVEDALNKDIDSSSKMYLLKTTNDSSISFGFKSLTYYLHFISASTGHKYKNDSIKLSPFQSFLLSLPVIDSRSGIVYKNKSIYDCNGAELYAMSIASIRVRTFPSQYLTRNKTESLDNLVNVLDIKTLQIILEFGGYQCNRADNDISKCPDSFKDRFVREACERIVLRIQTTVADDNNGTSSEILNFKNPFCLFCWKLKRSAEISKIQASRNDNQDFTSTSELEITFHFKGRSISLSNHMHAEGSPAWRMQSCYITNNCFDERKSLENEAETGITGCPTNLTAPYTGHRILPSNLRHACQVSRCMYSHDLVTSCRVRMILGLQLPAGTVNMTSERWKQWYESVNKGLSSLIPEDINSFEKLPLPISVKEVFPKMGTNMEGFDMEYEVLIEYKLVMHHTTIDWQYVKDILRNSTYPFIENKRYFCGYFHSFRRIITDNCFYFDKSEQHNPFITLGPTVSQRNYLSTNVPSKGITLFSTGIIMSLSILITAEVSER